MDNPTVGEYTLGISRNTVRYFEGLEQRARREKAPLRPIARDFQNPLFAILKGPLDPLGLDRNGRVREPRMATKIEQNVDKSVDKVIAQEPKRAWKKVNLADLREELGFKKPRSSRK